MRKSPRRKFVGQAAGVAAVISQAPFVLTTRAAEPVKKLGWALVGLGNLSTNQIAPALQKTKHARLAAVVSGTPQKLKDWAGKYNIPHRNLYNYETFDQIKDNPDIDVIYVVLPNALHGEYTIRAARAGKHVFCEKPMEISSKICQQMIDVCAEKKRLLGIAYRCQFVPHHQEAIRLCREELGKLQLIEASFGFRIGDPNQWRLKHKLAGGGALMDVGVYALQAARYLSGLEPLEITAFETKTDKAKFKEVDESIMWTMKFPGEVMANCGTTYNSNGLNRAMVTGEKGWVELHPAYSYDGIGGRSHKGPMELGQIDHFAAEMDDFSQCILEGRKTRVPGEEGLRDLKICEAIYKSIQNGGKTIKLS